MKCDEMKPLIFSIADLAYVDEIRVTKNFQNPHDHAVYKATEVDAAIVELKAENERLKSERDGVLGLTTSGITLEDLTAIAKKHLNETKRALWLARAERAVAEQTIDEWSRYKEKHPCGSWRADTFEYWVQAWIYVEKLCRKKAEAYK